MTEHEATGHDEAVGHGYIDDKAKYIRRLKLIEGQARGLQRMVENEDYCMDIITQSRAIQRSLESLNRLLLENHLRTHVTHMFEHGGDEGAHGILVGDVERVNSRPGFLERLHPRDAAGTRPVSPK